MTALRCDEGVLFGVVEGNTLEVKCRSRWCGHKKGVVVLHRFDLATGEFTTHRYKDPQREVTSSAAEHSSASVRSA